jgi:cyclase
LRRLSEGVAAMLTKRVIPCLDVRDGRVVKGIHFEGIRDAGDPVEAARRYNEAGADELVFLDINASHEGRGTLIEVVARTAEQVFIPMTVGGGIQDLDVMRQVLLAGADKISVNSPAVKNPALIEAMAMRFGSQCVTVAVDAKRRNSGAESGPEWEVYIHGGRVATGRDVLEWVREARRRGAGEILLTSMDADGTRNGYDIPLTRAVCEAVDLPVIASGGAGKLADFAEAAVEGQADGLLAASLFHYGMLQIGQVKAYLHSQGVPVRY